MLFVRTKNIVLQSQHYLLVVDSKHVARKLAAIGQVDPKPACENHLNGRCQIQKLLFGVRVVFAQKLCVQVYIGLIEVFVSDGQREQTRRK